MKKIVLFIIIFAISLAFIGCSNEDDNQNTNNEPKRMSSTPEPRDVETEIGSFSTTILIKDTDRQNNIQLACSELNGTVVKAGETFSFCDTLGPSTPEDGYEKADVFDADR